MIGISYSSLLGILLIAEGILIILFKTFRPFRVGDFFVAASFAACGTILIVQGRGLDPILQFSLLLLTVGSLIYVIEGFRLRLPAKEKISKIQKVERLKKQKEAFLDKLSKLESVDYFKFWLRWVLAIIIIASLWWTLLRTTVFFDQSVILVFVFNLHFAIGIYQSITLNKHQINQPFLWLIVSMSGATIGLIIAVLLLMPWNSSYGEIGNSLSIGIGWGTGVGMFQILVLQRYLSFSLLLIWLLANVLGSSTGLFLSRILLVPDNLPDSLVAEITNGMIGGLFYGSIFSIITGCALVWMFYQAAKRENAGSNSPRLRRIFVLSFAALIGISIASFYLQPVSTNRSLQNDPDTGRSQGRPQGGGIR